MVPFEAVVWSRQDFVTPGGAPRIWCVCWCYVFIWPNIPSADCISSSLTLLDAFRIIEPLLLLGFRDLPSVRKLFCPRRLSVWFKFSLHSRNYWQRFSSLVCRRMKSVSLASSSCRRIFLFRSRYWTVYRRNPSSCKNFCHFRCSRNRRNRLHPNKTKLTPLTVISWWKTHLKCKMSKGGGRDKPHFHHI